MATVRTGSLQYSKERVKKAGATARRFLNLSASDAPPPFDELADAIDVIEAFRAAHQYPLTRVAVGLRSMVKTAGCDPLVAQRLKRMPQVINKLIRFPSMSLARMEDVGGCRAVLRNYGEVRRVFGRIEKKWDIKYHHDYISQPKDSGYRGVHAVVTRDDRWIEVQLRTHAQQAWATSVEESASRWALPLKDGKGPPEVLEYYRMAAEGLAAGDRNEATTPEFERQFQEALTAMQHWIHTRH